MGGAETFGGSVLLRRDVNLERVTLAWNVVGIVVLAYSAVMARSVALAGFGLDSLVEVGASTVVLWELSGAGVDRNAGHSASSDWRWSRCRSPSQLSRRSSLSPATALVLDLPNHTCVVRPTCTSPTWPCGVSGSAPTG